MMTMMAIPPFSHLHHKDQKYKLLRCPLWKTRKKLLTMNSRGLWNHSLNTANRIWLASSDGPRICSIEANRALIAPCSSSRHAFFARISRDACKQGPGCNINYFNIFKKLFMDGIWFTALNTTNTHKLCSNDRFVIWLARAHWLHRKLKPMSCWESHESRHSWKVVHR